MSGHELLIFLIGLSATFAIFWRAKVTHDNSLMSRLPDLLIAFYLFAQGASSIFGVINESVFVGKIVPPLVLLLLPAAVSASVSRAEGKINHRAYLWMTIGLVISVYRIIPCFVWGFPNQYLLSSSLIAAAFLFFAMVVYRNLNRLYLGLGAIIWVISFGGMPHIADLGVGVFMGAVVFSSLIQSAQGSAMPGVPFGTGDFFKAIPNPFIVLDLSGKIVLSNGEFQKVSGYSAEALLGQDAIDFFDIPSDWRFRLYPTDKFHKVRCQLIVSGGEKVPVLLWVNEILNSKNEPGNMLCLLQEEKERELLENRLKTESVRFAGLYETSLVLSSSLEMRDVLKAIARQAENLTKADSCTIFSLDHARQVIRPIYASDEDFNAEVMNFELPVGQGLTGAVVSDGKARMQNFDDENKLAMHVPGTTDEVESLLSVPLVAKDAVIGALTLYKTGARRFEEDDARVLTVFASQASAIIETSRLYMKLKASEKLYRFSVDLAGDAIFFVDPETGKITDTNEMAQKILKYSRSEFVSMHIWEINPEPLMPIAKRLWQETKKIGWGKLGEIDYLARDGQKIPSSVNVSLIQTGEVTSIQWMVRDISEFKRAIEKNSFVKHIFEHLEEPLLITDSRGGAFYANEAFCDFFKIGRELLGKEDITAISRQNPSLEPLSACWKKLNDETCLIGEPIYDRSFETPRKILSIIACRDDQGRARYYVWFFHSETGEQLPQSLPEISAK